MRKRIYSPATQVTLAPDQKWLELERLAQHRKYFEVITSLTIAADQSKRQILPDRVQTIFS